MRRVLKLHDLIFYGIVLITPVAPVPIYGVAQQLAHGHVILSILLAGIAMMFTAFSYGRMANLYPSAGSAYVYVGRGLNAHLGFFAGWTMILDYLVLPIVAIIQICLAIQRLLPFVPYPVWVALCIALITLLNLRGIRTTVRTNHTLLIAMAAVIGIFIVLAVRYVIELSGPRGLFSSQPLYDSATFDLRAIATAASFAALTYIGFDGLTTLAEEVENPERNVPLATVAVCLFTALFSCLLVYLAQLIVPDYVGFANVETAFMDVTRQVGGDALFEGMGLVVILSSFGAALAGEVAASRVLLAMGRDNALPGQWFTRLSEGSETPAVSIVLISTVALAGSLCLSLERAGELLNFGALLGFMGVNFAAFRQCFWLQERKRRRVLSGAVVPLTGFIFCLAIWLTLPSSAKMVGGTWLAIGMACYAMLRINPRNRCADETPPTAAYRKTGVER
jgi:amino acid transporter